MSIRSKLPRLSRVLAVGLLCACAASGENRDEAANRWLERFAYRPPLSRESGVCAGEIGKLPSIQVIPESAGKQLVRISVPFAPGTMPADMGIEAVLDGAPQPVDFRILTLHPGTPRSVRRGMITFLHDFPGAASIEFALRLAEKREPRPESKTTLERIENGCDFQWNKRRIRIADSAVKVTDESGKAWTAVLIAPPRESSFASEPEIIESGEAYLWLRLLAPDKRWPRIIEVRMDGLGRVFVQAHLQRLEKKDGTVPDFGWTIEGLTAPDSPPHDFSAGAPYTIGAPGHTVSFPEAHLVLRGSVATQNGIIRYVRCAAGEGVPFQESAWRRTAIAVCPAGTPSFEDDAKARVDAKLFDALYGSGKTPDLSQSPSLQTLDRYIREGILQSALRGDDLGNVTVFQDGGRASVFGMNRLNHCPAIFQRAWRDSDAELLDTALAWCGNMHDLSLWWGDERDFGGTRYNNAVAANQREQDPNFMWRTNSASNFCTKGYDSFFYAFEETGDPRMAAALRAQVAYAKQQVHADQGECRNIGDVADFVQLYRHTGETEYLDEALRLFRELRTKLSEGDLFSQGGQPIAPDPPFIDEDEKGYKHPFSKPYIIGYALNGLPALLELAPDEPKLRDVIRAVADFLAQSQDPSGGWRYPHPKSSRVLLGQSFEHGAQLARAGAALEKRGEPVDGLLDAIETLLRCQIVSVARTGKMAGSLDGWERAAGAIGEGKTIYDLYQKPSDRPSVRDYTEGALSLGGIPPDGLVYFQEIMAFYLTHRPAERLLQSTAELDAVFDRVPGAKPKGPLL